MQFIDVGSNELTGKVPDLRKLQKLYHDNNFGGFLPKSIANISRNLGFLHLHNNQISGVIPREISNLIGLEVLSNLKKLGLSQNNLFGRIPSSFGNLTILLILYLNGNYLHDSIPASIGKCQNLEWLKLSQNNLSGHIPKEVLSLSSLSIELDLSYNQLVGSIPKEVGYLKNLGYMDLSYNSLSGPIPVELGSCVYLEMLNLTNNHLQGAIPSTFTNLRGLQVLQLSHNNLTGKVPAFLKDFKFLQNLNLSYNDFEGALPTKGVFNSTSSVSIVGNRKLCGGITQLNLPKCITTKSKKMKSKAHLEVAIPLILGIVVLALAVFIVYFRWLRGQRKEPFPNNLLENPILRVSYHSLFKSTNGFSSENLLGVGGFGAVYRGYDVLMMMELPLQSRSFEAECEILKSTRHRNLVKVLTACSGFDLQGNDFKALVYEYMDNGNLENWLHFSPQENIEIEENK
ncbi:PREDICTED: putative receptor-like protein kinase At3g47110 [Ipomoea nil]|uniref:putative receptor-like protein kinase At3g47110 n=1 Tax=Ipomoea nil TaxID=35883 RepID=UPI00090152C1|nr:PREDICTED: putative receptor-like protein kinase At3g47110 [Ipomoea nil]